MAHPKIPFEEWDTIVSKYVNGATTCELGKIYGVSDATIRNILVKRNCPRKNRGIPSNCDTHYFDIIDTPHKSYLLGFITADGGIIGNPPQTLSIEVSAKDSGVIYFARNQIGPQKKLFLDCYTSSSVCKATGKRYEYVKNQIGIRFNSRHMVKELAKYGVVPRKSKTISKVPIDLIPDNLLCFFFRGLLDGDGSVSKDGRVLLYSGSKPFIEDVQAILVEKLGIKKLKVYHGTTYFIGWSSRDDREKLFKFLYNNLDATYYYPRKYERLLKSFE